ncbi:MAG: heavy metal translocating P-type ATPase [Eggerthellaceae bacterium]|nr:heavy metal translocating P-type ATPase [Eggerthellaceae bacterium]
MQYTIEKEIPGRIRVKLIGPVPQEDLGALEAVLDACPDICSSRVYPRTGSIAFTHEPGEATRLRALKWLCDIDRDSIDAAREGHSLSTSAQSHRLLLDIAWLAGTYFLRRWFLPTPLSYIWNILMFIPYARMAARSLGKAQVDVPVLDAAAIAMSFVQGDPKTAGETMFLLQLGETMEDYTEARSESALIDALLDVADTANLVEGNTEMQVAVSDLRQGDLIAVRTGMPIVVDGIIESGIAMVNQASLTGEPLAIERTVGDDVFAGTSVEDGEIFVRCKSAPGESRLRSIVSLVKNAELYQSERQKRREQLAARIVPWNFLLAGVVALTTRSLTRTAAALMVDYSCGLRLTGSIAVLSAMSQSARAGFTVKGSKYFDAVCDADTIIFDKTGTLTEATPHVAKVLGSKGWPQREVLRVAACLEEHFPHPVARAVVNAAASKNLEHREMHGDVEYLVAHGIVSTIEGKRAVIGSEHFVVEDEHVTITARQKARVERELEGLSPLYLAVDGKLVGIIGIEDPLKAGVASAVDDLRKLGFSRIVMLTGDNERTAERIAAAAGLTEFRANQLPEDKHAFIDELKAQGCNVIMVGDGVNDAPALAQADVGIAMGQGTAVAKEVADITLSDGDLSSIVQLVKLSRALSARMDRSFAQVIGLNSAFMAAGITGVVTPQTSSLLHNATTIALSLDASRPFKLQ